MCKCIKYSEVKNEIQQHLKKGMLIPVLGSGFTRECTSRAGKVPSGDDYKQYMINEIIKVRGYDISKKQNIQTNSFLKYQQYITNLFL
ncbi:hypothetical protein GPK60_04530 [Ruminococcus sp. MCC718]|uniref:hypothetical protein n=1 Tax=Ruminococcus sp. MCC718 TaxID=2592649 RepID=UPI001C0228F3|nr:hypothetical protein [Ruminococcus sp. MCC718]MBT9652336.1 hypothetical protein [Ruminococcus sp. MCC718]